MKTEKVRENKISSLPIKRRIEENIPLFARICAGVFLFCLPVRIISSFSSSFADFFNNRISPVFRRLLAYITNIFSFSVAEMLVYILPFFAVFLICILFKRKSDKKTGIRIICSLLGTIMLLYALFVFTFACGYRGESLDKKLSLEKKDVSASELYKTSRWLSGELSELCDDIVYGEDGASIMPYSFSELNDKLLVAYDKAKEKYDFIDNFDSRVKEVASGEYMSYLHILGVYSYFTGEANVNTNPPDYTTPYTMAHEMAHQRGIAREDEANFMAFLVCLESDDTYIRYSAYLEMFEYVQNSLYKANTELYRLSCDYPKEVYKDRLAYYNYYIKYADNPIGEVSSRVNDTYLKSQGTQGRVSYGMVTDLTVAYYLSYIEQE
ncbi:MAG: DUF3810 domain-containing protein [Eubacteriales bacterium]|nr:DUF3810 domain-containing protein [Eubacteriales bacterium]